MEARDRVNEYLHLQVGHLVRAGQPRFDGRQRVWRVPVLAHTRRGLLQVGEVELTESLELTQMPSKAEVGAWIRQRVDSREAGEAAALPAGRR